MISPYFAKAILNALFHTKGTSDKTAQEEKDDLLDKGVPWHTEEIEQNGKFVEIIYGVKASAYADAYEESGFNANCTLIQEFDKWKELVNATSWYKAVNTAYEPFDFKDDDGKVIDSRRFNGWTIAPQTNESVDYPKTSFLALFTHMPDQFGKGYVEPQHTESGDATNYMRVNLHEGIITGNKTLKEAAKDEITGEAVIVNGEIIAYPEVEGVSWGNIVGFGVFREEEVMTGDPVFWGTMDSIEAIINRVPLFRAGNFKITLQ